MAKIRSKRWSKEQKFSMVLSLVKGEATAEVVAKRYGVGKSTLYKWRDAFLQGGQQALAGRKTGQDRKQELEVENQHLKEALADAVEKLAMQQSL
jgi:transposase-like protein